MAGHQLLENRSSVSVQWWHFLKHDPEIDLDTESFLRIFFLFWENLLTKNEHKKMSISHFEPMLIELKLFLQNFYVQII